MNEQNSLSKTSPTGSKAGYLYIAIFVVLSYLISIPSYYGFTESVLPAGDPFTYTVGFFKLIQFAQQDYWGTLWMVLTAWNWYWMMNIPIVLLSPILVLEPFSISIINYIMYGLATASFFRLAKLLNFENNQAFLLSLILWIYPINYGFSTYSSLPMLGLDAMFSGALYLALAQTLCYMVRPEKWSNALLAGVCTGFAIWGRGNSILVVGFVLFIPGIHIFYKLYLFRTKQLVRVLVVYGAVVFFMAAIFYTSNLGAILGYYEAHAQFIERHQWSFNDSLTYFKNIPGFMFWRDENSGTTIFLSYFWHLVTLLITLSFFNRRKVAGSGKEIILRRLAYIGAFIYFGTYVINIALFSDPLMNIYNCLLIYRPMLIGLTLSLFAYIGHRFLVMSVHPNDRITMIITVVMILFAVCFTKLQTPKPQRGYPTPQEVEQFALRIDDLTENGSLSVLWYSNFNAPIFQYYRIKNGMDEFNIYTNKYYNNLYSAWDYSEENRERVKEEVRNHLENASAIIIAEFSDLYYGNYPYAYYKFKDDMVDYINSPDSPKFVVIERLLDHKDASLLVLRRAKDVDGRGEPLKLPYGPRPRPDFFKAVNRVNFNNIFALSGDNGPGNQPSFSIRENLDSNEVHSITGTFLPKPSHTYHISTMIKAAGRSSFRLQVNDQFAKMGTSVDVNVAGNASTTPAIGAWGGVEPASASLSRVSSGWYKLNFNFTIDQENEEQPLAFQLLLGEAAGKLTYNGDGMSGVMISSLLIE